MRDLFDPTALEGLRYLDLLRHQPVRPSVEAFEGFLDNPRPERRSLTDALRATKTPTGAEILAWMLNIQWVNLIESGDTESVDITDLGCAILSVADISALDPDRDTETTDHVLGEPSQAVVTPISMELSDEAAVPDVNEEYLAPA